MNTDNFDKCEFCPNQGTFIVDYHGSWIFVCFPHKEAIEYKITTMFMRAG